MSCQKWTQLAKVIILVVALVGCNTSKIPIAPTMPPLAIRPTQDSTATPIPTPTTAKISSFDECYSSGYRTLGTYPRQCITSNGETFTETLDEGVIFENVNRTYGITSNGETTLDEGVIFSETYLKQGFSSLLQGMMDTSLLGQPMAVGC
jgi:hypothetical protein